MNKMELIVKAVIKIKKSTYLLFLRLQKSLLKQIILSSMIKKVLIFYGKHLFKHLSFTILMKNVILYQN